MKKIILIIAICTLLSGCEQEKRYCGPVTEKYLLHKNNGGTHNIVFYCNSEQQYINVSVTPSCYVNTKVGQEVCFDLNDKDLGK